HSDGLLNQTLAVTSSKDGGKTWSESKLIVAIPDRIRRPGMAIVTKLPNGKYFMVYEIVNDAWQGIYFKTSDDGLDYGDPADKGTRIETADGHFLGNMPYVVWTKHGGPNGTIIVSGHHDGDTKLPEGGWTGLRDPGMFLVNYNLGEGPWEEVPMLVSYDSRMLQAGWSMGMVLIEDDSKLLQLCPTQMDPVALQITYGLGTLIDED
ncbi:MAG: hypothetical protein ACI4U2_01915, partial [Christensenellaceae bacterium]